MNPNVTLPHNYPDIRPRRKVMFKYLSVHRVETGNGLHAEWRGIQPITGQVSCAE